ncbi:hypothetical protein [Qipengyuania nanhaisediminis]|uniref:hypothetical protein n=1 Tax=Qipengyuania nanhaisediminis TaxID=604088 RepID=UPI0038B27850
MLDMDLVLIFSFITVVTLVLGISVNAIVAKVLAHRRWEREREAGGNSGSAMIADDRVDLIEDRVRVLERLATDRGQLLSDEIEALRDERARAEARQEARREAEKG